MFSAEWESLARRGKCAREGILCVWVCELDEMTFLVKIILVTLYTVQTMASRFFRFTCISFVDKMIDWQVSYDRFGYQCLRWNDIHTDKAVCACSESNICSATSILHKSHRDSCASNALEKQSIDSWMIVIQHSWFCSDALTRGWLILILFCTRL